MKFNYVGASFEELVKHIVTADARNIAAILAYYKSAGNSVMYVKVFSARKKANKIKRDARRIPVKFNWHDIVYYDETSASCLRWKVDRYYAPNGSVQLAVVGDVVGGSNGKKYKTYRFMYKYITYLAHRVVWELHNGEIPEEMQIDHIDGDSTNNKLSNLRTVTQAINSKNCKLRKDNSSGTCGVGLDSSVKGGVLYQYWVAYFMKSVGVSGKKYFSVKKYGYEGAYSMACEYREKMIELLNENGEGYTARHGKETT